nr:MAG TPA: RELM-like molecule (RELM) hormone family [Caudoviricetes sp.]
MERQRQRHAAIQTNGQCCLCKCRGVDWKTNCGK